MKRVLSITLTLIMSLVSVISFTTGASAAPMPGAIWTTDINGAPVNQNIYTYKTDVYLNGGPKSSGSPGLPDGLYYVKVTAPNGEILGKSNGDFSINPTPVQVVNGRFVQRYQLYSIVRKTSSGFMAWGYDTTPNPGGEYKVWISQDPNFANSASKTDNFKVLYEGCGG